VSFSNLQITLNTSGLPNVSSVLVSSDYPSAAAAVQAIKNNGLWVNTTVGGANTQFIPPSAILYITVS